jgi:putative transposase
MARIARVILPGIPHHITQRGNRRMQTFFRDSDYLAYINLMAEWCQEFKVEVWAYCLMPNHVHMIAVPETEDGLRRAIGEAHRRYTRMVNFREGWRGHLWQGRFSSFPMDEEYLLAAARYVEWNPVRAGLVKDPCTWQWSSATAHVKGEDDDLATVSPLLEIVGNWREFLGREVGQREYELVRSHERTGRPLGSEGFIESLEKKLERVLRRQKPRPKPKRETSRAN